MHSLDEFWHRKYAEDKERQAGAACQAGAVRRTTRARRPAHAIHLPSPSYWPLVAALGLPMMAYGVLYSWWLVGLGALVTLIGSHGWALEPSVAE